VELTTSLFAVYRPTKWLLAEG